MASLTGTGSICVNPVAAARVLISQNETGKLYVTSDP